RVLSLTDIAHQYQHRHLLEGWWQQTPEYSNGLTCLDLAILTYQSSIVPVLINKGVDIHRITTKYTALERAVTINDQSSVKLLLDAKAEPYHRIPQRVSP